MELQQLLLNENKLAVLQFLIDSGQVDFGNAEEEMRKSEIKKVVEQHPYKIYQAANGYWCTYVRDEDQSEKRRRIVKATEEKLYEALYEHYKGFDEEKKRGKRKRKTPVEPTLESLFPSWLEYKSLHTTAPTYIARLKSDWNRYYKGTDIVKVPIKDLRKLELDEWVHRLIREQEVTQKQFSNFVTIMNQVLDYAVDLEIIWDNPFRRVKVSGRHLFKEVKKKDSASQVFTREEERILKEMAWKDFEDEVKRYVLSPLAVAFQFETGVRIGELCVLRFSDVEGDFLLVQRMYRRDNHQVVPHTKGSYGDRRVILTSEAKRIIETCRNYLHDKGLDENGYIFSTDGEPCSYYAISDLYRKYCKKMGITQKSSHKARKTVISALIDGNVNINSIREMVGHRDERTTFANYVFDRSTDEEKVRMIEEALSK